MDRYGYIGIETLLRFCENSKDHDVTPNDFMRMPRTKMDATDDGTIVFGVSEEELYYAGRVILEAGRWCKAFYADEESNDAALHESCTDCPLYDQDKHSCPRFNKVIPATIQEIKDTQPRMRGKWVYNSPVTMKCDQCGFVVKDWDWHRFNFCPNCSADMREE